MKALRRLFRRRTDPARARLDEARRPYEAAVAKGSVRCRLCDRPGVHIGSAPMGEYVALFALCAGCRAMPDAEARARAARPVGLRRGR